MTKHLHKIALILILLLLAGEYAYSQSTSSLHYTRKGKEFFYKASNQGFEIFTNIPYNALRCNKCHPGKLANNTPIDTATYTPSCNDCHNFNVGTSVPDTICLRCHSRQKAEKNFYTDKHRSAGFTCVTCHTKNELHADGTNFNTMLDTTLGKTCNSAGCHVNVPVTPDDSLAHAIHGNTVECAACHVRAQITCYNCHFETELWSGTRQFKRPHQQAKDFLMLGRITKKGKVGIINYQSLKYQNKAFVGYGPFYPHTIMHKDSTRSCGACHNNSFIQEYNSTGGSTITVAKWDSTLTPKKVVHRTGVIPIPPNWRTAFKMDFVDYTGRIDTTYTNPGLWIFMKSQPDSSQMLAIYAMPLTAAQMTKLGSTVGITPISNVIPDKFALMQNYPNPFNPVTLIKFSIPFTTNVSLRIYNILGAEVASLVRNENLGAGEYEYSFNASKLSSGVYFYVLNTPEYREVKKMTLVK